MSHHKGLIPFFKRLVSLTYRNYFNHYWANWRHTGAHRIKCIKDILHQYDQIMKPWAASSTIFMWIRVPGFLHTIYGQRSSRATSVAWKWTSIWLGEPLTPGGSLPSPACVRWWGEVNWAVRTAVNVSSVKANTAEVITVQNPCSTTCFQYVCVF